jgi:hypothetical protein
MMESLCGFNKEQQIFVSWSVAVKLDFGCIIRSLRKSASGVKETV